jgi:hypothetical protein
LPQKIWSRPENPGPGVARRLRIEQWELREAIHKIKQHAGLRPDDNVVIWSNGSVANANGTVIGNVYDEL